MWKISKSFSFCYGHRVHNQELIQGYATDTCPKCRHLHGHEGLVWVYLEAPELTPQGMVTDFKHLGWFKEWLDTYLDHKFILDINDPLFSVMVPLLVGEDRVPVYLKDVQDEKGITVGWIPDMEELSVDGALKDYYEGFFFVSFVPTSENLSQWLTSLVRSKMEKIGVRVAGVEFWETPKSRSQYICP